MRAKKNREVNIFSASVVDLFASGLGVFLIVSIIALVNQKKESAKVISEKDLQKTMELGQKDKLELQRKIETLEKENFDLKVKKLKSANGEISSKSIVDELKMQFESEKSKTIIEKKQLLKEIATLKAKLGESKDLISELNFQAESLKSEAEKGDQGVSFDINKFEVGTKIRLENVQFYPGTDRPIEPYASREIKHFADYLNKNTKVYIEVSGHIFETKKAIEAGNAVDEYNLSGARASRVCDILESFGVNSKRLRCIGYGATRYVHLTDDQYSLEAQKNRRVEVEILSK